MFRWCWMWSSWARPVLPRASLASPARWHIVHSIHVSRHTVYWVQAQVGFGRVYFPGPNRVGARAHFMRWAQPILRLSRRACARANDGLASVNAGQPLMKNLSHFVKSVLYLTYTKNNTCPKMPLSCLCCPQMHLCTLPCKAKRQYLLTFQVSRYCLLPLQSSTVSI